jgi:DNA-binding SARP family transcriptional activator/tetratricopeptide (TPR) repeat protein
MKQPLLRAALLGPLQVWHDDVELSLGPGQQRLLLALLLARAGDLVEISEITALIWGDDPRPSAVNMVHRYVGALRRLLEPGLAERSGGRWIVRETGGYRFVPRDADLDVLAFRDQVTKARDLAETGDDAEALASFIAGLHLWRGRAGAGFGHEVGEHPDFTAINREYVMAVREAAQVARRCRRSELILPAVREAATRNPLDEALQAELMLLLAADGKQSEALTVFGDIRDRLDDELGISPGPELNSAHETVLRRTTPAAATVTSRPAVPAPAQLPSDLPVFTGRDTSVLAALRTLTEPRTALPMVAFTGMPGIGKTTLAVHVGHLAAPHFPDGQLHADLHGFDAHGDITAPADVLRDFLGALGFADADVPASLDARASLFRSVLAERRMLVLLDNARDAEQVRPLLPGTAGNAVIITSRSPLVGLASDGAAVQALDVPSMAEARTGVIERIGLRRAAADPGALDELIRWCGRLPLALALICAQATAHPDQPLASIAEELRRIPRLDAVADDADQDVRAVFSWSYRLLSAGAARLFRLLPLHPGTDFAAEAMASLTGEPERTARAHLAELVRTGLVSRYRPTRYRLHDLLHAYALELGAGTETPGERRATHRRIFGHYLHTAANAVALVRPGYAPMTIPAPHSGVTAQPFSDESAVMAWSAAERHTLSTVIDEAATRDDSTAVWQLAVLVKDLYHRHGWWKDWAAMFGRALSAAERAGDLPGMAHSHRSLAVACHYLHDPDAAAHHLKVAYELFTSADDALGRSMVQMNVGYIAHLRGEPQAAFDNLNEALSAFRQLDQPQLEAVVLATLADAYLDVDDEESGIRMAIQAAQLCCRLQDVWNGTRAANALARIHRRNGRFITAIRLHQHCIDLLRRRDAVLEVGHHRNHLAETLLAAGDTDAARQVWTGVRNDFAEHPAAPPAITAGQRLADLNG